MGKTLDECYEVLGLDFNATEGMLPDKRERVLDLVCGFHTFSVIMWRNACYTSYCKFTVLCLESCFSRLKAANQGILNSKREITFIWNRQPASKTAAFILAL